MTIEAKMLAVHIAVQLFAGLTGAGIVALAVALHRLFTIK